MHTAGAPTGAGSCATGFLLGSRQTLLETKDGGKTWEPRTVAAAQVGCCVFMILTAVIHVSCERCAGHTLHSVVPGC